MAGKTAMNLLLDSATFLWLCAGDKQLSARVAEALRDPANSVNLSAVTAWEIGIKHARGKLKLPAPLSEWFPAMVSHHRLMLWPIEAATAIASTSLPPVHQDPFDRLLIAFAQEHRFTLTTPDVTIPKYPNLSTLW
jgi:PIN domain nuclease of toxin-antitoxin system